MAFQIFLVRISFLLHSYYWAFQPSSSPNQCPILLNIAWLFACCSSPDSTSCLLTCLECHVQILSMDTSILWILPMLFMWSDGSQHYPFLEISLIQTGNPCTNCSHTWLTRLTVMTQWLEKEFVDTSLGNKTASIFYFS